MAQGETYTEFVDKFMPKKTTDDCYTPPVVHTAVASYVAKRYGRNADGFVRPFYPGGDYEHAKYPEGCTVVDNPPFSILSEIVRFYIARGVKFFLYAPTLTSLIGLSDYCTALICGIDVVYENGASVKTSFVTNLEPDGLRCRSDPELYQLVQRASDANQGLTKKTLPVYEYPAAVVTAADIYQYSARGVEYEVQRAESVRITALDAQKEIGKAIFGAGLLLSTKAQAVRMKADEAKELAKEREAKERAAAGSAFVYTLSLRERAMIAALDSGSGKMYDAVTRRGKARAGRKK